MNWKSGFEDPDPNNLEKERENDISLKSGEQHLEESPESLKISKINIEDSENVSETSVSLNRRDRLHRLFKATLQAEPAFETIREKIKRNKINKTLSGKWDIIGKMEPVKESKASKVPEMVREVRERLEKIHSEIIRISKPLKLSSPFGKSEKELRSNQSDDEEFKIITINQHFDSEVINEYDEIEKQNSYIHKNNDFHGEEGLPEVY